MAETNERYFDQLASFLNSLGGLFTMVNGKPGGWLWEQIKNGVTTEAELQFSLEQTPQFQERFKVIFDMREQARQGRNVQVLTAQQVLEYETKYAQIMAEAGAPSWFYDELSDAHDAIRANLSPTQVKDRVERGYTLVQSLPPEIKSSFEELYGVGADAALLAAVLDPEKTLTQIDRSVRAASVAGYGRRQGLDISAEQANRYSQLDVTPEEIEKRMITVATAVPLTQETIGESGTDLTTEVALSAGLGQSATDKALLEQRLTRRQLGQRSSGGGALTGQSGITGASVV
jgi:hypothetical protein